MAGFLPDTSCMVATVCGWHEHHARAAAAIQARLAAGERLVVAAPALIEAYAVLTRLPAPHRVSAADAATLLDANFLRAGALVALDAKAYRTLLREAAPRGISGGRTYDAVIAGCAAAGGATSILTFNDRDFAELVPAGIDVVVPPARV